MLISCVGRILRYAKSALQTDPLPSKVLSSAALSPTSPGSPSVAVVPPVPIAAAPGLVLNNADVGAALIVGGLELGIVAPEWQESGARECRVPFALIRRSRVMPIPPHDALREGPSLADGGLHVVVGLKLGDARAVAVARDLRVNRPDVLAEVVLRGGAAV